jgi:hypothetical protein
MRTDLQRLRRDSESKKLPAAAPAPKNRATHWIVGAALIVIAAAAAAYFFVHRRAPKAYREGYDRAGGLHQYHRRSCV